MTPAGFSLYRFCDGTTRKVLDGREGADLAIPRPPRYLFPVFMWLFRDWPCYWSYTRLFDLNRGGGRSAILISPPPDFCLPILPVFLVLRDHFLPAIT